VFSGDSDLAVEREEDAVQIRLNGSRYELSEHLAGRLREALGEALVHRREFLRTVGITRADGSYVVRRRAAESSGNAHVFENLNRLHGLFEGLPETFGAEAIGSAGLTGSRRHMLLWHFVEHPEFACELRSRNPLEAQKS
jgi:hypothetical protein